MSFRVAVDVGGTFTDLVCTTGENGFSCFKSRTTPGDLIVGVLDVLKAAASHYDMLVNEFLAQTTLFAYGTTSGTNAVIEQKGAKTGFICTKGFRDTLLIREGGKEDIYNMYVDYPEPYVPRYLTLGVTERINSEGGIEISLNENEVREAIRQFKKWNVEAIAVGLLWSIANPVHEKRIGEIIEEEYPNVDYSLSHDVNPVIREYRRFSATAIDASLKKLVIHEVTDLRKYLEESGFSGVLLFSISSGGQTSAEDVVRKPIFMVLSGPSMGPVAGNRIASAELDRYNIITIDMGGTSFDASIITNGRLPMYKEGVIGDFMLGMPSVDVKTIGAGGGSIAWLDASKFIHVGPRSAGAVPGPACYNQGGSEATVTDANLARGFLNHEYFLGGAIRIFPELAENVISRQIAEPLGLRTAEAAALICLTCEQNMIRLIKEMTIRQGVDPREYVMVAGGAAAGLHAVPIARELGIRRILVPKTAGVLSALGLLVSDVRCSFAKSFFTDSLHFDYGGVNKVLRELEVQAKKYLAKMNVSGKNGRIEFTTEVRYPAQVYQLTLDLRNEQIESEQDLALTVRDFHDLHEKVYSVRNPEDYVEFVEWGALAVGSLAKVSMKEQLESMEDSSSAVKEKRPAYFVEGKDFVETTVYDGDRLTYGNVIAGPAIIEEKLTTVVVFPQCKATVTRLGNYLLEML